MRKCPQCSAEYGNEIAFCLNDGTQLVDVERFSAGENNDDEPVTIIRNNPIVVDFGNEPAAQESAAEILETGEIEVIGEIPATQTSPQVVIVEKKESKKAMYGLFLTIGLLLGGLAALATLYFSGNNSNDKNAKTTNVNITLKNTENTKPKPAPTEKSATPQTEINASEVHKEKTFAPDADFNGRVITLNAYVRSAPSKNAAQTGILPMNDRITIGERQNPNSPWYKVTCEHGVTGWMHGDTIEFTR